MSVKPGVVIRAIQAVGTLRANESVIVRPELGGRIQEVHFKEGQAVEKGAPLVTMETSINAAELEQAKARLGLSQVNDQRMGSLRKKGLGSEQEEDQMRSDLRVNQASVALAEARLAKMTVRAPFNGVLGLRLVSVGDYLSPGQDMVNLLNLDPIKVDFRIPELLLSQIKVGQAIEVKVDAFPDQKFSGAVYAIDPQVDVNGRSLLLRATIPNKEQRLYAGLFARVDLILERRDGALLVPEEALVPQGDKQYVFKVVEDKAVRTEVKLGQRQGAQVEIADGLKAGDQVVTAGQIKIRDGAPVKPISLDKG
ncbi:MAG: efflux RND transporter periplasmic adaptor subunit [Gammaproteobacteria bacterium]